MSIPHAANRFRKTPIDGWDGTQWIPDVTRGSFVASQRFLSDRESDNKLRTILLSPDEPLPPEFAVIRVGGSDSIYLVGRTVEDAAESPYSLIMYIRRAYYQCSVLAFIQKTTASGLKVAPSKGSLGTFFCDRETVTSVASKEFDNVKFGDEVVVLPRGTPVNTTNEILIGTVTYEVEQVYDMNGYRYCRSIARPTSSLDSELRGVGVSDSLAHGGVV